MAGKKYYAVKAGRVPGIYDTWADCEANVKGFAGAEYKSFGSAEAAEEYLGKKSKDAELAGSGIVFSEPSSVSDELDDLKKKAYESLDFLVSNNLILPDTEDAVREQIDAGLLVKRSLSKDLSGNVSESHSGNDHVDVFVDGSYNSANDTFGYGVYMDDGANRQILSGMGKCQEGGRNVEGEVAGARAALSAIMRDRKYKSVTLYHDYQGIGSWADRDWKANKGYTSSYAAFVNDCRRTGLNIEFEHVDGHTGVQGNEYVDKIAKLACGIPLTSAEKKFIEPLSSVPGYPLGHGSGQSCREVPEVDQISAVTSEKTL